MLVNVINLLSKQNPGKRTGGDFLGCQLQPPISADTTSEYPSGKNTELIFKTERRHMISLFTAPFGTQHKPTVKVGNLLLTFKFVQR